MVAKIYGSIDNEEALVVPDFVRKIIDTNEENVEGLWSKLNKIRTLHRKNPLEFYLSGKANQALFLPHDIRPNIDIWMFNNQTCVHKVPSTDCVKEMWLHELSQSGEIPLVERANVYELMDNNSFLQKMYTRPILHMSISSQRKNS